MEKSNKWIIGDLNFSLPSHMNFGKHFLDIMKQYKNNIALRDGSTDEKVTYEEMILKIMKISTGLRNIGVNKGDVIAVCSENRIETIPSIIAVLCAGAVATMININLSKEEIIHITNISKPKYVIFSPNFYNLHYGMMKDLKFVKDFFVYGKEKKDNVQLFSVLEETLVDPEIYEAVHFYGRSHPAVILYSSGTTGLPKGVLLSHLNFISTSYHKPVMQSQSSVLNIAPFTNTMGFVLTLDALIHGKTIVFLTKFTEDTCLQAIQKYKIALLICSPSVVVTLCKTTILDKYDMGSLELMLCGGAPMDVKIIHEIQSRLPNLKHILQGYGMTEASGTLTKETDTDYKLGTVGKLQPGNIVKVVDTETGQSLGPNQQGEICFKGMSLFEGYIGQGIETDDEGFFKTGDIGYYDEDGFFYIVDRIKELIKYTTMQVPPSQLEAVILEHPNVKDVGVVGLPDKVFAELPAACVVLKPNSTVTEQEIIDFVTPKVSPWKQLRGGVKFVEEIPKNPSGKILRRKLRELLIKRTATSYNCHDSR